MNEITPEMMEDFERFKAEIQGLIGDLAQLLYDSVGYSNFKLDYELSSVDLLELFYLDVLAGKEKVKVSDEILRRMIIAYFGEALIRLAGGYWELCELEDDEAFGMPVIVGFGNDPDFLISPVEIQEDLYKNRQKGKMRNTIEYCLNKNKFETEFVPEFYRNYVKKVTRRTAFGYIVRSTIALIAGYLIVALFLVWWQHMSGINNPPLELLTLTGGIVLLVLGYLWYKYLKARGKEVFDLMPSDRIDGKNQQSKMYLLCYKEGQSSTECSISNDDPWFNEDFVDGKRIEAPHDLPIRYEADRYFIKTDYPLCARWFLISKKFAAVLKTLNSNYQELPSVIYRKDRMISEDFVSFIFTASYPAMDMKKSVYKEIRYGVILGLDKIALSKKQLAVVPENIRIFRLQEATRKIVVSEAGKNAIETAGIAGVGFKELEVD